MAIRIENTQARRIFLDRQGLGLRPTAKLGKAGLLSLIEQIGFVQVDSIRTVERAHHMILFARNQTYRREDLTLLLEKDGALFEHWTHDASIIPANFFPYWKHKFAREQPVLMERWRKWRRGGFEDAFETVLSRIRDHGPVMARHLTPDDHVSGGWWEWHPAKTALEYLWRTGQLSIAGRVNFQKVYDLSERVISAYHYHQSVSHEAFIDWAASAALDRLGFATPGEIAAFFDIITPVEARQWVLANGHRLVNVDIMPADGQKPRPALAWADVETRFADLPPPPARLRVLSPFDPLLRDRARAERLFGFSYRIEVFVPEAQRVYGYYVFPLLEGDRMIGRVDMKADRKAGTIMVRRLWLEPGVRASAGRLARLDAELARIARFIGVENVSYGERWL